MHLCSGPGKGDGKACVACVVAALGDGANKGRPAAIAAGRKKCSQSRASVKRARARPCAGQSRWRLPRFFP